MKRLILLAGAAGLFLVSAAVPSAGTKESELSSVLAAPAPAPQAKPAPAAKPAQAPRVAENRAAYPRCSATVQDRCVQGRGTRTYAPAPARRIQLASRAGERG
jgi:hypothetical protein